MASIERARWIRNREKGGGGIHLVRFNGHRRRRIEWKRRGGGGQAGTEQRHDPGDEIGTKVAGMRRTWKFETDTSKWNADPKVGNPGEYSLSSSPPLVKLDYFVRGKDEGVRTSFLQISRFIHIRFERANEFVRIRLVWNRFRCLRFSERRCTRFREKKGENSGPDEKRGRQPSNSRRWFAVGKQQHRATLTLAPLSFS